jgi:DedD protein
MPFFKFRQRGQPQPELHAQGDGMAVGGAQETIDGLRRRARHRLIGAAVLVLAAVIGFPLMFDAQPRPVAVNAPITIPDKDKTPPLRQADVAASLGEHEELVASSAPKTARPATSPASPAAPASHPAADEARARREAEAQARQEAEAKAQARREVEAKARRDADAKAQAKREADAQAKRDADAKARREAQRARALLEGRHPPSDTSSAAAASGGDKGRFMVQIGAFADADKVRDLRQQAERAGFKTFTQTVDTKAGKRTRVRAGPFASRAEAEKAAAALKKAGLPGSIAAL